VGLGRACRGRSWVPLRYLDFDRAEVGRQSQVTNSCKAAKTSSVALVNSAVVVRCCLIAYNRDLCLQLQILCLLQVSPEELLNGSYKKNQLLKFWAWPTPIWDRPDDFISDRFNDPESRGLKYFHSALQEEGLVKGSQWHSLKPRSLSLRCSDASLSPYRLQTTHQKDPCARSSPRTLLSS
jgi:hypothetical protein